MGRARSAEEFAELERRAGYTSGEVAWLLAIGYRNALADDALPSTSGEGGLVIATASAAPSDGRLFTVLRWVDVDRAARRAEEKIERQFVELIAQGHTEREAAAVLGRSHATTRRRFRASIEEVLRELAAPSR